MSRMLVRLARHARPEDLKGALQGIGIWASPLLDEHREIWGFEVQPHSAHIDPVTLQQLPGVAEVLEPPSPHPRIDALAKRCSRVAGIEFGRAPVLMAGPCGVESEALIHETAACVAAAGGKFLRGGAYKPRTSPDAFRGHGRVALGWLRSAADQFDLKVMTEITSEHEVDAVARAVDLFQVGSRNMQNFDLLRAVGATGLPVLLKRGAAAPIDDWLMAGEHLAAAGCPTVIFCERGIMSFDANTRNLLDLAAVAVLKQVHNLTVIVDPSHAIGRRDIIPTMARAALAAGADGLLLECHPAAQVALSDGPQALSPQDLLGLARDIGIVPSIRRASA